MLCNLSAIRDHSDDGVRQKLLRHQRVDVELAETAALAQLRGDQNRFKPISVHRSA